MKYVYNGELDKLKKFGYQEGKDMLCCSYSAYGKIYEQQLDKILNVKVNNAIYVIEINKRSKEIELNVTTKESFRSFCYTNTEIVKPYIEDLIQARLVNEEVE